MWPHARGRNSYDRLRVSAKATIHDLKSRAAKQSVADRASSTLLWLASRFAPAIEPRARPFMLNTPQAATHQSPARLAAPGLECNSGMVEMAGISPISAFTSLFGSS